MTTTPQTATVSDEAVQAIDRFSEAAKTWGWVEDQGFGSTIIESENEFKAARENLDAVVAAISAAPCSVEVWPITIEALQLAHIDRQKEWCPDQQPDLSFRGNEMAGEVGEACNVIKKLERERQGWRGSRATKEQLADELADVIHTAILCAITAGVDLHGATINKFNATSDKNNLSTRLSQIVTKPVDVAAVRKQAFEEAARIADYGMMVPPDGGSPTCEEIAVALRIAAAIRALSPAEPVDQSRVAQLEAALTSILFEDSDKSEQQRMIDRVRARAVLEQSEPVPLAQDVINLVISAREVVYGDDLRVDDKLFDILDKAAEAFASRVPWENEPYEPAAPASKRGK